MVGLGLASRHRLAKRSEGIELERGRGQLDESPVGFDDAQDGRDGPLGGGADQRDWCVVRVCHLLCNGEGVGIANGLDVLGEHFDLTLSAPSVQLDKCGVTVNLDCRERLGQF